MMIYKLRDGRPTPKVMRVRAHRLDDVRVPLFSDDESVDFQPALRFALVERVQQVFLHGFDFTIRDEEDVRVFPLFGV